MHFRKVTNFEDFLSLKEQWNSLVKSTDVDHAFMRHEWFESWINHLMPKGQLIIHTAWNNDRLVAIAPLQITRQIRKKIPLRLLSFLRSSVTPRSNFIVDNSIDSDLFFDSIFNSRGWDVAEFQAVELGQQITDKFIDYLKKNQQFVIEEGLQSPYEIIDSNWEIYLKNRSLKFKKNYRNSLNRLKKASSYQIIRIENFEDFHKYYENMVEISNKSWKSEGKTDLKSVPRMANFYYDFCKLSSKDNLFLSIVLIIDRNPAAFSFYLKFHNRLVALRWEYDEQYKYYAPGTVLKNDIIKSMLDKGIILEFDLSGMSTPHKKKVVNRIRKHIDITVGNPGFYGSIIISLKKKFMKSQDISSDIIL